MQTQKQNNADTPAFPPQLIQDNFGQIVALVPGMTKKEYFAIQILPTLLNQQLNDKKPFKTDGKNISVYEAAVISANKLLESLEQQKEQTDEKSILQVVAD